MTKQSDANPKIGLSAATGARQTLSDVDRDAALALRLETWNPAREERLTKQQEAFLHLLRTLN